MVGAQTLLLQSRMKNLFVFLLIILIFIGCAVLGFGLMSKLDQGRAENQPVAIQTIRPGNQHDFVLIQVDALESGAPKLIAAWFVSLFVTDNHPPTLTFNQIYPSQSNAARDQAIEQSFTLDEQRSPVSGFWKELEVFQINWEGYLLVDDAGAENIFAWLKATEGLDPVSSDLLTSAEDRQQRMQAGCQAISLQSSQADRAFSWDGLLPDHFQSNIRMEVGLSYWAHAMNSNLPIRCEVYQAP